MTSFMLVAGWSSLGITVLSYIPYIAAIFKGRATPHAFSWFSWGFVGSVAFFGQHVAGAGPGAWASGMTAFFCSLIFVLALFKGEKHITRLDVLMFGVGITALVLWAFTNNPTASVVLATLGNVFGGHGPTLRKVWGNPWGENLAAYALGVPKWGLAILGLEAVTFTTLFYPVAILLANVTTSTVIWVRRAQMRKASLSSPRTNTQS